MNNALNSRNDPKLSLCSAKSSTLGTTERRSRENISAKLKVQLSKAILTGFDQSTTLSNGQTFFAFERRTNYKKSQKHFLSKASVSIETKCVDHIGTFIR